MKAGAPIGKAESNAIPFRKGNPKFKQAIDKALADMKADGSYAKISTQVVRPRREQAAGGAVDAWTRRRCSSSPRR